MKLMQRRVSHPLLAPVLVEEQAIMVLEEPDRIVAPVVLVMIPLF
jgi:hypothetical protein